MTNTIKSLLSQVLPTLSNQFHNIYLKYPQDSWIGFSDNNKQVRLNIGDEQETLLVEALTLKAEKEGFSDSLTFKKNPGKTGANNREEGDIFIIETSLNKRSSKSHIDLKVSNLKYHNYLGLPSWDSYQGGHHFKTDTQHYYLFVNLDCTKAYLISTLEFNNIIKECEEREMFIWYNAHPKRGKPRKLIHGEDGYYIMSDTLENILPESTRLF